MELELIQEETKKVISRLSWGTISEKNFIKKLGTHIVGHCTFTDHFYLLRKYNEYIKKRMEWSTIDRNEIMKFVIRRMKRLEKRGWNENY